MCVPLEYKRMSLLIIIKKSVKNIQFSTVYSNAINTISIYIIINVIIIFT